MLRRKWYERPSAPEEILRAVLFVVCRIFEEAPRTAWAGENEDVKGLLQLENDMARAWVQRDTQTLDQILADDYTLTGTADALIGKREYIAGLDNSEFETDSAIVNALRIRV